MDSTVPDTSRLAPVTVPDILCIHSSRLAPSSNKYIILFHHLYCIVTIHNSCAEI